MTRSRTKTVLLALLPIAVVSFSLALRFPARTDALYSRSIYLLVARAFAFVNRVPFSLAEPIAGLLVVFLLWSLYRRLRRGERRWRGTFLWSWCAAGVFAAMFLVLWGFNYARPSLADRAGLSGGSVDAQAVLSAGERAAETASSLFDALDNEQTPTVLPFTFDELNRNLDEAFERLSLPGDGIEFDPTPAKPLASSTLFSYLGISGIFIPFTGEPSVNVLQPDVLLPIVVAHEKAHQRGVTHEGEANFAAFLACADESSPTYFRYAAYLFATRYLLTEASFYLPPSDVDQAWSRLGEGPSEDVRAIREFWRRYQGPVSKAASRANDRYLRAMQVEGGAQSYGTVVQLLMALDERGEFIPQ